MIAFPRFITDSEYDTILQVPQPQKPQILTSHIQGQFSIHKPYNYMYTSNDSKPVENSRTSQSSPTQYCRPPVVETLVPPPRTYEVCDIPSFVHLRSFLSNERILLSFSWEMGLTGCVYAPSTLHCFRHLW